jgi:hypothetical protein
MRKILALVAAAAFVAAVATPLTAAEVTVKGEVVDMGCAVKKAPGGKGDEHAACAMACAKRGLPTAIMTADAIYQVAGDYAANNNAKMLDFVAKRVEVTGDVTEKDGQKVITIKSIKVVN